VVTTRYVLITLDTNGRAYYDTVLITVDTICGGFVWPGDADDNGLVDNNDLLPIGVNYGLNGPARLQQDIRWYAHNAAAWTDTIVGGINDVFSDCNGDGVVDVNDVPAILQNFSLVHAKTGDNSANRSGNPALSLSITADTVGNGDTLVCHILLGDTTIPATNVYGIAFTFNFNQLVVDSNGFKMTFGDSWLATQSQHIDLAKNDYNSGAIYAGLSRIDHTTRSGAGEIATVNMVITTDNIDGKNLSYYTAQMGLSFIKMIDQFGNPIPVNREGDSAIISFTPVGINAISGESMSIKLFPDPANNQAQLISRGGKMNTVELVDVLGRNVATFENVNASNFTLPTAELKPGVYFAVIETGNGRFVKKFLVQH